MTRQKSSHVDSAEAVGLRIRAAREREGLLQRDLAFPGCSSAYVSRIEAGQRIPSLQLLREIGARLGVSADFLARGEDPPPEALDLTDAQLAQRLGQLDEARAIFARLETSSAGAVRKAALLGLGEIALSQGELDQAIELLEQHMSLPPAAPVEAAAVEALVHAYATRGDRATALTLLDEQLKLAAGDSLTHFRLSVIQANALIDLGEFDRAELAIAASMSALGSSPEPMSLARCLWSQSRLQTARGSADLAARYAEQALAIIKGTEHVEYAARAKQLLAHIELERGNPTRALELLDEALPPVERVGDRTAIALLRLERARALAAVGRLEEAQALAEQLVRDVDHLSRVDAARALAVLADISAAAGNTEQALDLYEAASNSLADITNAPMLAQTYERWFELLVATGRTEEAVDVARRGMRARLGSKT